MLPTEPTISQSNFNNTLARLWKGKNLRAPAQTGLQACCAAPELPRSCAEVE